MAIRLIDDPSKSNSIISPKHISCLFISVNNSVFSLIDAFGDFYVLLVFVCLFVLSLAYFFVLGVLSIKKTMKQILV